MSMRSERRRVLSICAGTVAGAVLGGGAMIGAAFAQKAESAVPNADGVIRVTARRFVFLPREMTLKRGLPVTLELTSADVVMGFNLPDFNVRADIVPGQVSKVTFTPDKVGSFMFICDIFCGDGHEGMEGKLHVVA
jgi:cytochrome c oxidase subunit 2